MSKFVLRNLKNEKRRLEKLLKKIDREIHVLENPVILTKGIIELTTGILALEGIYGLKDKKTIEFNMECVRYGRDVVCTLKYTDEILGFKVNEKFCGVATCASDDKFDASVGINLSLNRAVQDFYQWMEETY